MFLLSILRFAGRMLVNVVFKPIFYICLICLILFGCSVGCFYVVKSSGVWDSVKDQPLVQRIRRELWRAKEMAAIQLPADLQKQNEERAKHEEWASVSYLFPFGMPEEWDYPTQLRFLPYDGFVVGYDEVRRQPAWVVYKLSSDVQPVLQPRRRISAFADDRTVARISSDFYEGSGYSPSPLVTLREVSHSQGSKDYAQIMSMAVCPPMTPQAERCWRAISAEVLEMMERYGEVWVVAGTAYVSNAEELKGASIPQCFFKMVLFAENDPSGQAIWRKKGFILTQIPASEDITDMTYPASVIEELSGFVFHPKLLMQRN